MPLFRKKPVVIQAVQLNYQNWNDICDFVGKALINEQEPGYYIPLEEVSDTCGESGEGLGFLAFAVTTTHGERAIVRHGDWVIPDSKPGTFYPCKPDVFAATYESFEDSIARRAAQEQARETR